MCIVKFCLLVSAWIVETGHQVGLARIATITAQQIMFQGLVLGIELLANSMRITENEEVMCAALPSCYNVSKHA